MALYSTGPGAPTSADTPPAEMTNADRLDAGAWFLEIVAGYLEDAAEVLDGVDDDSSIEATTHDVIADAARAANAVAKGRARLHRLADGN